VKSRSSLTLHSGVYYFDSLTIVPQGKLLIDDARGPVQTTRNSFSYRGEIRPATIGIPKLLIGVRGTGGVMIEAPFHGRDRCATLQGQPAGGTAQWSPWGILR
jgi:hypothetical protein